MNNFGFFLIGLPLFFYGMSTQAYETLPYWARVTAAVAGVYSMIYAIQHRETI